MLWPPLDAFANSNVPFCDFNLNKFLNSIFCVPHLQKVSTLTIANPVVNGQLGEGMGKNHLHSKNKKNCPNQDQDRQII